MAKSYNELYEEKYEEVSQAIRDMIEDDSYTLDWGYASTATIEMNIDIEGEEHTVNFEIDLSDFYLDIKDVFGIEGDVVLEYGDVESDIESIADEIATEYADENVDVESQSPKKVSSSVKRATNKVVPKSVTVRKKASTGAVTKNATSKRATNKVVPKSVTVKKKTSTSAATRKVAQKKTAPRKKVATNRS